MPNEPAGKDDEKNKEEKEKEKKGPMSFLDVEEQEKVRKLVAFYQKNSEAEVGVQTEPLAVNPTMEAGTQVQLDSSSMKQPCQCHNMLFEKLTTLEMKLDKILQGSDKDNAPAPMEPIDSNDCVINDPDIMESISKVVSLCMTNTLPGMVMGEKELLTSQTTPTQQLPPLSSGPPSPFSNFMPSVPAAPTMTTLSPNMYDELFKKVPHLLTMQKI